jgi:hypothetical protein
LIKGVEGISLHHLYRAMSFLGEEIEDQKDATPFAPRCTKDLVEEGMFLERRDLCIKTSVTVIIGLGGRKLSMRHAVNTGKAAGAMNPTYFSALTLMVVPGSPLDGMVNRGEFELVTNPMEILKELRLMIENIDAPGPVVFCTNHASNYLPLRGTLPRDKESLLETIQGAMDDPARLRPEYMRGL